MTSPRGRPREKPAAHSKGGTVGLIGISSTVGPCRSHAAATSAAIASTVVGRAAVQPYPFASETMSRPGRSSPGTPGVSSSTAKDLRIAYSLLHITTNSIGSCRCAAVQIDWTEYWNDPVTDNRDDRPVAAGVSLAQGDAHAGRTVPAETAASEGVEAVGVLDRPGRVQVGEV